MKVLDGFSAAILLCGIFLPACAQQSQQVSTPRPDTPFSAKAAPQEPYAAAEQQLQALQDIHQRMMTAKTARERQALMAEHSRAMRNAMAAMEGMHRSGMGPGGGMAGHHMQRQLAMMQTMMQMMMDRIDLLSVPAR